MNSPPAVSRPSQSNRWLLALTLTAGLIIILQRTAPLPTLKAKTPPASSAPHLSAWARLENCRLLPNSANDGDSFKISSAGRNLVVRLYFADCPETIQRSAGPDRIADQARYFGGIGSDAVITTGQQARNFTANLLSGKPFTIFTRWERVFDSHRFYAHVSLPTAHGAPSDLAERLVAAGLARIHTTGADHPLGPSERQQLANLRSLEKTARSARRGAWLHTSTP